MTAREARSAFTLVEVVIALGVVAFAVIAILGLIPIGLQTGHASQDETRAAQIAQTIFSSMASQGQTNFTTVKIPVSGGSGPSIDLSGSATLQMYADNDGKLSQSSSGATYNVAIITDSNVASSGFDSGYANKVNIQVRWPMKSNPGATPAPSQSYRNHVRFVSRY